MTCKSFKLTGNLEYVEEVHLHLNTGTVYYAVKMGLTFSQWMKHVRGMLLL